MKHIKALTSSFVSHVSESQVEGGPQAKGKRTKSETKTLMGATAEVSQAGEGRDSVTMKASPGGGGVGKGPLCRLPRVTPPSGTQQRPGATPQSPLPAWLLVSLPQEETEEKQRAEPRTRLTAAPCPRS